MSDQSLNSISVNADLKRRVGLLYSSMSKKLGIKEPPKILFSQDLENAKKPFGLTGYYDQNTKTIRIFITGRHPTDILRTFAHELIHHWQNERGTLTSSTTGQEHYAQKDPNLRQREKEAYVLGNILFRDWQDECRYGKLNENTITKSELKKLIKERISILFESISKKKLDKDTFFKTWTGKYDKATIERLWKTYSRSGTVDSAGNGSYFSGGKNGYFSIGFTGNAICWIWDPVKQIVLTKPVSRVGGHGNLFGNEAYKSFRGRYDTDTHKLSITIPDEENKKWTGKIEKDLPPNLIVALKNVFKNPEMYYFPYFV